MRVLLYTLLKTTHPNGQSGLLSGILCQALNSGGFSPWGLSWPDFLGGHALDFVNGYPFLALHALPDADGRIDPRIVQIAKITHRGFMSAFNTFHVAFSLLCFILFPAIAGAYGDKPGLNIHNHPCRSTAFFQTVCRRTRRKAFWSEIPLFPPAHKPADWR